MKNYKAYIVDMDGTLYFKRPMQLRMAWQLGWYYLFRLRRVKELLLLRDYRRLREREEITGREGFESVIRQKLAENYALPRQRVDEVVDSWMLQRPLEAVGRSRDEGLLRFLREQQSRGARVFVYSDYPAEDKCRAIGFAPDGIYWPDGVRIRAMKPEPEGLALLLEENGLKPEDALFIGDRAEKDGKCAAALGVDAWILPGSAAGRKGEWEARLG